MAWYISTYARLHNGGVELLSYVPAPSFDVAVAAEQRRLPNNKFYHAENRVGSLLPKPKVYWVARDVYSHKPHIAELQIDAELKAQHIMSADDVDFNNTMKTMHTLKSLLTKAQYDIVLQSLMRKPSVMKHLYERRE